MPEKLISLIIVPHHKGKSKSISLSKKSLKILGGAIAFLFVGLVFFLVDYFAMNVTRQKYKDLLQENSEHKVTLAQYQDCINELKSTIGHFENYAKKLNIMAGLKSPEVLKELGIGGGNTDNDPSQETAISPKNPDLYHLTDISQKANGIEKNLGTLVQFFEDQSLKLAGTPTIKPTAGWVTSAFGWRSDPFTGKRTFHYGIDIATHYGNPVVATADGIVVSLKKDKIGGRTILISHKGGYTTVYCHLSKFLVKPGHRVKRGDIIGEVGKTGKALGPHVHYEVRVNGKPINPYYYLLEE